MEIVKSMVVKSIAGHDQGSFYAVLSVSEGFAEIADGKHRLLSKPKRKSLKHLRATQTVLAIDELTDKKLREALHSFNSPQTNIEQGGNVLVKG